MPASRFYLFVFESHDRARQFVRLVASVLDHVIMYIDGEQVHLLDGSEDGQHMDIIRLARSSSAQRVRVGGSTNEEEE
jgi:hypothetical protein